MGLEPKFAVFNQRSLSQSQTYPVSPFTQSAMMRKIARRVRQAISVGGSGPVPNRLPHYFG